VFNLEAAFVDNAIFLDYLPSDVALVEAYIGTTDPNIRIDNNCTDDKHHSRMPRGSRDHEDKGDVSDIHNPILAACLR
jgi:hypothetical protein